MIVETDDGLTGYGEAKGTPVVMKVLVEDVLGPQLVGEDPTRVEFLWEKMYSASRLPLALAHGRPYHRAGQSRRDDPCDQRRGTPPAIRRTANCGCESLSVSA